VIKILRTHLVVQVSKDLMERMPDNLQTIIWTDQYTTVFVEGETPMIQFIWYPKTDEPYEWLKEQMGDSE
jgi:hypothetical protein